MRISFYKNIILVCFIIAVVSLIGGYLLASKLNSRTFLVEKVESLGSEVLTEKKIQEVGPNFSYKINARYPYTSYSIFNQEIEAFILETIHDFLLDFDDSKVPRNQAYSLIITYEEYFYQEFISYVFTIFQDIGGAHPNTTIHTITFNKKQNEIVTIDTLVDKYPNILSIFSEESRKQLSNSQRFKDLDNKTIVEMIEEGTRPNTQNFRNFVFSKDGLVLFFETYQVAPYVYGSFHITVPYSIILE